MLSIFNENNIPNIIPAMVAVNPIRNPVRKKDLIIDFFGRPKDLRIAISFVLFLIKIVKPEIILNAATIIIKVNIKNITLRSTFKAEKKDLFWSAQELT